MMNIKRLLICTFLLFVNVVLSQQDYKGKVFDSQTKEPLPYVNIGIFGKDIGTVSDEEGLFNLVITRSKLSNTDVVQFSSMGYETIKRPIGSLVFGDDGFQEILMKPKNVDLNEVVVTNKGAYEINEIVGYQNYGERTFGYWKDDSALGAELATKIKIKKGLRKLNTLFFEVFASPSDSLLMRVNLYDTGKSKTIVGKNLNTSNNNILYSIYPTTKLAVVDLTPFNIYVDDDFYVSLELLNVHSDKSIALVLKASSEGSTNSLRTTASLGKWELVSNSAMAYHLNSTFFSTKKKANNKVAKAQKTKQNISGFIFISRRGLSNIKVTNLTTNEVTYSNDKGRYQILGKKDDILIFEGQGYKKLTISLLKKTNVNINLQRE